MTREKRRFSIRKGLSGWRLRDRLNPDVTETFHSYEAALDRLLIRLKLEGEDEHRDRLKRIIEGSEHFK